MKKFGAPLDLLPVELFERHQLLSTAPGPTLNTNAGEAHWARVEQELNAIENLVKGKEGIVGPVIVDKTGVTHCSECEKAFEDCQLVLMFIPTGLVSHIHCVSDNVDMNAFQPVVAPIDEVAAVERAKRKMDNAIEQVRESIHKLTALAGVSLNQVAIRLKPTDELKNQEATLPLFTQATAVQVSAVLCELGFEIFQEDKPTTHTSSGSIGLQKDEFKLFVQYKQTSEEREAWREATGRP